MQNKIGRIDRAKYLSKYEAGYLLRHLEAQFKVKPNITNLHKLVLCTFALSSGLRASELALIKHSDIDTTRKILTVHRLKRRAALCESLPLTDNMLAVYTLLLKYNSAAERRSAPNMFIFQGKQGSIKRKGLWYIWCNALKDAKLPNYKLHAARHTLAMELYNRTGDIRLTQLQLGHSTVNITSSMYAYPAWDRQYKEVNNIF